jgi:hypothetical protein
VAGAGELPEQFERVPGRGGFHVRAGRNESRPMVRTTALTDRTHGDRIRTLGAGKDVGHGGGEARAYAQAEGDDENFLKLFLRVFSLEEASFSIG